MPNLDAGESAKIVLGPSDSVRVSAPGQASVLAISGAPSGTTTVTAQTRDFGPYNVAAVLRITGVSGITSYGTVDPVPLSNPELTATRALVSGARKLVGVDVVAPVANVSAAAGSAGVLTGTYYYGVAWLLDDGSVSPPWPGTASAVTPSSQQVNLTAIPVSSSPRVVGRVLLRTSANPVDPKAYQVLATINDNTTTTYTDNIADGSLGAPANWDGSSDGNLQTSSGVVLQGLGGQSQSLAFGYSTNAGYASVHVGAFSGQNTTTGRRNNAFGVYAGAALTTGYENALFGTHSGNFLTTNIGNTFLGVYAGFYAGTGAGAANLNVAVGSGALQGVNGTGIGQQNTALGYRALYNINTADSCIGIGSFAGQFANASRQLFIDTGGSGRANLAAQQNDGLVYGEIPNAGNVQTQRINLNGSVRLGSSTTPTVANLPAAAAGLQGCRRYVTDASVAYTSANVGTTVAGGGANCVPVFCTGTAWVIG